MEAEHINSSDNLPISYSKACKIISTCTKDMGPLIINKLLNIGYTCINANQVLQENHRCGRGFLLRESIELCRFNALKMITVEALYSINIR
jgi:hypothetical protein